MKESIPKKRMVPATLAAEIYSVSPGTLGNWRSQGRGPRFYRCGAKILYRVDDLESFFTREPVLTKDFRE